MQDKKEEKTYFSLDIGDVGKRTVGRWRIHSKRCGGHTRHIEAICIQKINPNIIHTVSIFNSDTNIHLPCRHFLKYEYIIFWIIYYQFHPYD